MAGLTCMRVVFLGFSCLGFQPHLLHELIDQLVVNHLVFLP